MDNNQDGKTDAMAIAVTLPLQRGEKIHHLSAFFVLEYMLQVRVGGATTTTSLVVHWRALFRVDDRNDVSLLVEEPR